MTLSRQFLIIISLIFISVFVSNFFITMQNTKEYIEEELSTKAQDTATSLGMLIKPYIANKKDAEIALIINAVSDSGFYNEIRLEDAYYSFSKKDLAHYHRTPLDISKISNISVSSNVGSIEINDTSALEEQLNKLEDLEDSSDDVSIENTLYTFVPGKNFQNNQRIKINFDYKDDSGSSKKLSTILKMSNIIVKKVRSVKFDSVPNWFLDLIQFKIGEQKSEISDSWKVSAVVFVKPNPGIAYEKLYKQFTTSLLYACIIFITFIVLIIIFVKILLKPLKEIEKVTSKIAACEFERVKKIPWTREFKSVALAINDMSGKLENIIVKLNKNIQNANQKLSQDQLTKLEYKESFDSDMKKSFIEKKEGYVILLKIADLTSFAKTHGRLTVNDFIVDFSNILKNIPQGKGYRFFGSEFVFTVSDISDSDFEVLIKKMLSQYEEIGNKYDKKSVVHMGASKFDRYSSLPSILSSINEAYSMAKVIGDNSYFIQEKDTNAKGALQWLELINDVIERKTIKLNFVSQTESLDNKKMIMVEAFSEVLDKALQVVPIGMFISLADENGKMIDFDKIVVEKIIDYIDEHNIDYKIAINLSITSMLDLSFLSWIETKFEQNPQLVSHIIFSVSAFSITNHLEEFKKFINIVSDMGIEVMIKRFENKFISTDQLKYLKPNIIRLAKNYTSNIGDDQNQLMLVDSICNITNILNIKVIAEGVNNNDTVSSLSKIGIYGVSK